LSGGLIDYEKAPQSIHFLRQRQLKAAKVPAFHQIFILSLSRLFVEVKIKKEMKRRKKLNSLKRKS
jgi:hypothetical protein